MTPSSQGARSLSVPSLSVPVACALIAVFGWGQRHVWADFVLIDDFQAYALGSAIDGQGFWQAEVGANPVGAGVVADPFNPANHVLSIGEGGFTSGRLGHRETINTNPLLRIAEGSTATLFFRVAWDVEQVDLSIGMTEVANPISDTIFNSFTQFRSQLSLSFTPGVDKIRVRDGTQGKVLTEDVESLQWYNVWMVIDNAADATEIFIQGGAFATQTQLDHQGATAFAFRNGATTEDLVTLFIATGRNTSNVPPSPTENIGPVYLDSIYIDTAGVNLVNPVPEPSCLVLGLMGGAALGVIVTARRKRG